MHIATASSEETFAFAKKYSSRLRGGEIIGLVGDLGAGKTVFTKGLASGLGVRKTVSSPTFVLMKIYPARKKPSVIKYLCHIDAYRLKRARELLSIGAEEYFSRADTVTVIEWADRIKKILPEKTKYVKISHINDKNSDKKRLIKYV